MGGAVLTPIPLCVTRIPEKGNVFLSGQFSIVLLRYSIGVIPVLALNKRLK